MAKKLTILVLILLSYWTAAAQTAELVSQNVNVGTTVRLVALGDLEPTKRVDLAIANWEKHEKIKFDFGLILGDNFYETGVRNAEDPRWKSEWEDLFGKLGFPFFTVLGNHDYRGNSQAQVDYTKKSPNHSWNMPARYYSIHAGPVDLFAMDTCTMAKNVCAGVASSPAQLPALSQWLEKSSSPWKIVFGHHPMYSGGEHGSGGDLKPLYDALAPVVKNKADFYLSGHDHDLELVQEPQTGLFIAISGSGGHNLRTVSKVAGSHYCTQGKPGFATLEISEKQLRFAFVADGKELFFCTIQKGASGMPDANSCSEKIAKCPD